MTHQAYDFQYSFGKRTNSHGSQQDWSEPHSSKPQSSEQLWRETTLKLRTAFGDRRNGRAHVTVPAGSQSVSRVYPGQASRIPLTKFRASILLGTPAIPRIVALRREGRSFTTRGSGEPSPIVQIDRDWNRTRYLFVLDQISRH